MTAPFRIELDSATLIGERREGNGIPLVLAHGFGGSRHDWQPLIDALPGDLPLITYDQRGFGDSTGTPDVPFSHSDDLLALLDSLGIVRVDLCGMSQGGAMALNFALDHPDRVRRLVLVSPGMVGWSWSEEWVGQWKQVGRAARAGDMAAARDLWWQHPFFEPTRKSSAAGLLRASIDAFHGQQWIRDDQQRELPDVDRLTDLAAPTLLLTGSLDFPDFRLIAELIEGAGQSVARIDHANAGHMLILEIPGTIAGEIVSFLST
ncbi:alpha/beta fold hydrolase [Novosphingobium album (ex Hu et al. 2023)]|uniref:Alpha/beta hydrolase n=1 Tax=Novosphingobium album (ex Hu et al. 2023) TaxID=2930093 RepID=A0ABT0B387_9SPHN|nr:alpha/beta hydrolase [Novosphingobium album (ex Hu et al. 2023)]MCJ2179507.1 alpha/beta hydrolase [Novosphingobium album (ex Hu et al. 2023)]